MQKEHGRTTSVYGTDRDSFRSVKGVGAEKGSSQGWGQGPAPSGERGAVERRDSCHMADRDS